MYLTELKNSILKSTRNPSEYEEKKFYHTVTWFEHDKINSGDTQSDLNSKITFEVNLHPKRKSTKNVLLIVTKSKHYKIISVDIQPDPNPIYKFHWTPTRCDKIIYANTNNPKIPFEFKPQPNQNPTNNFHWTVTHYEHDKIISSDTQSDNNLKTSFEVTRYPIWTHKRIPSSCDPIRNNLCQYTTWPEANLF